MKITIAVVIAQLILIVTGSDVPREGKRVTCHFMGSTIGPERALYPEDIDASICNYLVYLHGGINKETEEFSLKPIEPLLKTAGEGFVPRLAKLKAVNPDLKVILHVADPDYIWILQEPSRKSKIIQSGVKWLNASGFDGFEFPVYSHPDDKEGIGDLFCEIRTEFDKHGYILTSIFMINTFSEVTQSNKDVISKMGRCCEHITLTASVSSDVTFRLAPLNIAQSNVDKFIEAGLSPNKIMITVPAIGIIVMLEDPKDNGLGANFSSFGYHHPELGPGITISCYELVRKLNDSSLEWNFRRDNQTGEPYAFSTTGLWTSYEDSTSMEFKARYVLEKGLRGIALYLLETEDIGNIGKEGRFPLTSAVYRTFSQGLPSANTTS